MEIVFVPKEPTEEMIDACFGSLERYFATLPPGHGYRKKGWINGAKAGARVKHAVRYRAMLAAAPVTNRPPSTDKIEPTTFVPHVGMVVAIDRVEGALNYVNLALAEVDDKSGGEELLRQYLINARFLLIGQKAT